MSFLRSMGCEKRTDKHRQKGCRGSRTRPKQIEGLIVKSRILHIEAELPFPASCDRVGRRDGAKLCLDYSAATDGCDRLSLVPARAFSSSSQRMWCSLAQLRSTVPLPMASNAPSMPIVPM